MNFSDQFNGVVQFSTERQNTKKYNTSESQTNNIKCSDSQVQSYRSKEKECQTVISKDFSDYQHDNSDDLLNHLQKMENRMLKYLKCNSWNKTAAYFPINSDIDSSCMNSKKLKGVDNADDKFCVTSISWNLLGTVFAVAYGKMDHNDCCTDKTNVNFWSVNRLESNNTQPDKYVEVAGCVVSLAYHSSIISIIACATFNGEIIIYDLSLTECLLLRTSAHSDKVIFIKWIGERNLHKLFSCGNDGKVRVWDVNVYSKSITMIENFAITNENIPRSMCKKMKKQQNILITSCDFSFSDHSTFVIGSVSGLIFCCSTNPNSTNGGGSLNSAVTFVYEGHNAPVHCINFSPLNKNLFASCSYDGSFAVYSIKQNLPLVQLDVGVGSLFSIKWLPHDPTVLAISTEEGCVLFYELSESYVFSLVSKVKLKDSKQVYALSFSDKSRHLCIGDDKGICHFLTVNEKLSTNGFAFVSSS